MGYEHLVVEIVSSAGVLNPAYVGFTCDAATQTTAQNTACVLSYLAKASMDSMVISSVMGVTAHPVVLPGNTLGPGVAVPLPTAELADWHAIDSDSPTPAGWGFNIGDHTTLAPVGTSINVMEYTSVGGRHNGRHYLPWVYAGAIDNDGLVGGVVQGLIQDAWNWRINGSIYTQPTWFDMSTFVIQRTPSPGINGITAVSCKANPARLRSRIR